MDEHASFGYWLRRRRKALDLTQAELAQRVGCATHTIRRIEADERRPSKQLAELLADHLSIPPAERLTFLQAARAELAVDRLAAPTLPRDQAVVAPVSRSLPSGTVTFLFTDIEGSTKLWEQHPNAMPAALARHDAIVRAAIDGQGGVVFRTVGDAFCAAFARATDALSAAVAAQRALQTEPWAASGPLRVRMALHTGVVALAGDDYQGLALSRVARLLAAGHGGQLLLSRATHELIREELPPQVALRDLGEHRLKDLTHPEQIFQLVAPDLLADFPPLRTLERQRTNLPAQPTTLIGREHQIATIQEVLRQRDVRLLTLSGPGGTGKTRLALQAAAELLDDYTDGVWFVNLAPISDVNLMAATIAQTLGLKETGGQPLVDTLKAYLREKHLLLVLDNFEQLLSAAPVVAELLAAAPHLKLLITSRAVLHLSGEHEYGVPPLSLPDPTHLPALEQLSQYEAVRLFIARAQAVKPDFAVTNASAPAIAEICYRLDGLPLAIELAATRSKLFPPEALLKRLHQRLPLLTGGMRDLPARQQTLRNTIDWSYQLLRPAEQVLFRRLAVFVGGWTLEAAEAVCGDWRLEIGDYADQSLISNLQSPIFDGLVSLLDQSLVRQVESVDHEVRFTMLETIREYALSQLEQSGEVELVRERHAAYYLALVEAAYGESWGPQQAAWRGRLERDFDNLRVVFGWSRAEAGRAEIGARLAHALGGYWWMLGYISEGRSWLEAVLASNAEAGALSAGTRAKVLFRAGSLAYWQDDRARARELYQEASAIYRDLDDKRGIAMCLVGLGIVDAAEGYYASARALYEEGLTLARESGYKPTMGTALTNLAGLATMQQEYAAARQLYAECLAIYQEPRQPSSIANTLANLGHLDYAEGHYASAHAHYQQSLGMRRELGDKMGIAECLEALAWVAGQEQQAGRAAQLLGAAEAVHQAIGLAIESIMRANHDWAVVSVQAMLGEEAFAAAWAEGQAMTLEQAIAYALGEDD